MPRHARLNKYHISHWSHNVKYARIPTFPVVLWLLIKYIQSTRGTFHDQTNYINHHVTLDNISFQQSSI